jgi:hypothetical protein
VDCFLGGSFQKPGLPRWQQVLFWIPNLPRSLTFEQLIAAQRSESQQK